MSRFLLFFLMLIFSLSATANPDTAIIRKIHQNAHNSPVIQKQLKHLCKKAPGRLVGSKASEVAVKYMYREFQALNISTWLQPFKATCWKSKKRPELSYRTKSGIKEELNICELGPSVSTPKKGIKSNIIEVQSFKHLKLLGKNKINNKIVFYNTPMDSGYSKTVKYRFAGASKAAEYGASAVIIRSLTHAMDDYPHTGTMRYTEGIKQIPAVMISSNDAVKLHKMLHHEPDKYFTLKVKTEIPDSCTTWNVIAEIKGSQYPDRVILVGGHIDAWHNTQGAHDDAAGCVMTADVLRIFKELNIQPRHTIRAVMFMDEEYRQSGSETYAKYVKENRETHVAAIESDAGAFEPKAFGVNAKPEFTKWIKQFEHYFTPYHNISFNKGYGGVDIMPLKLNGTPLIGYEPRNNDYFKYHHSAYDTYEKVNYFYLQSGAANIATLVYLLDQTDIPVPFYTLEDKK